MRARSAETKRTQLRDARFVGRRLAVEFWDLVA
jgi:hypothetical protein